MTKKACLTVLNFYYLLATGFGSGLFPIIPGTIGSLIAILSWLPIFWLLPIWCCWLIILVGFIFGSIICQLISNNMLVHDHNSIVWDEFVGMWMTIMAIPTISWQWVLIAFICFRLFDILKPWPISWFDKKISGGLGIMLDDIAASFFAIIIIIFIEYFLNSKN